LKKLPRWKRSGYWLVPTFVPYGQGEGDSAALNLLLRFKEYAKSQNELQSLVIEYESSEEKGTAGEKID
jgi:hypothetical protein